MLQIGNSILLPIPSNLFKSPPYNSVGPCCVYCNYTALIFFFWKSLGRIPNQSKNVALWLPVASNLYRVGKVFSPEDQGPIFTRGQELRVWDRAKSLHISI